MYRKFLNARSPLRLLEKGLHGGLGKGNLGLVLAGHGVGKTACLVGIALDDLLRGGHVLHVALDQTVGHVRAFYDTVFEELTSSTQLKDAARERAEVDRRRSIRTYAAGGFSAAKLREAVKFEGEAGAKPGLVIVEGFDFAGSPRDELTELRALAAELQAEIWLSASVPGEQVASMPAAGEGLRGPPRRRARARAGRLRRRAARAQGPREPGPLGAPRGARPEDAAAQAELSAQGRHAAAARYRLRAAASDGRGPA